MTKLAGLAPERVFYFFEKISDIPRGSGNEKAVSDYVASFAKKKGLYCYQDKANNVLVKKPGTPGQDRAPAVILQGHLDMVCEKNSDTEHDFLTEPLKLVVDGDFVRAEGTTLGADNGIAVAYMLALLDADDISHPPLEAVFTTGEEIGMEGAKEFDASLLSGKLFLNIDTEEEGHLVASCCGGMRVTLHLPIVRIDAPGSFLPIALKVSGLKGGHSGQDIHLQRPNANKLMGHLLYRFDNQFDCKLVHLSGGLMDNAIAREAEAVVLIKEHDKEAVQEFLCEMQDVYLHEFAGCDEGITLTMTLLDEKVEKVFDTRTAENTVFILQLLPNGVITKSIAMEGLVESSSNIGVVRTTENEVEFTSAVRSSVESRKQDIIDQMAALNRLTGGTLTQRGGYPSWEFNPDSRLLALCKETYKELFDREPAVDAIHAGLECGLFSSKLPGCEMISFGPEMYGAHSPDERLSVSSTQRTWEYIKALLAKIK